MPVTSHEGADTLQLGAASYRVPLVLTATATSTLRAGQGPTLGSTGGLPAAQAPLPLLSYASSGHQPTRSGLEASGPLPRAAGWEGEEQ